MPEIVGEGQKKTRAHFNKTKSKVGLPVQKENSCTSEVMKSPSNPENQLHRLF